MILLLSLIFAFFASACIYGQGAVSDAERAFQQFDYTNSVPSFNKVWKDTNSDKESRIVAAQRLAYLDWHVDRNFKKAKSWTENAIKIEATRVDTFLLIASIEREAGHYKAARKNVAVALEHSKTNIEKRNTVNELALISIAESQHRLAKRQALIASQLRLDVAQIINLTKEFPEDVELAKQQLHLSLLAMEWQSFITGWKNYFRVSDKVPPTKILKPAYEKLKILIPKLQNHRSPNLEQSTALVEILGESRLFGVAATAAKAFAIPNHSLSQASQNYLAYAKYLQKIEEIIFAEYRSRAVGGGDWQATTNKLTVEAKQLWSNLKWKNKPKTYSSKTFIKFTRTHFGAYRTTGIVNGHNSFYVAHSVSDETYDIRQYGQEVKTQVVTLDEMASSDFSGWFLNEPRVGGSAKKNLYLAYRRSAFNETIQVWYMVSDKIERERTVKKIAKMSESDLNRAKSDPHAFLPGLSFRLAFRFFTKIYDDLEKKGNSGAELKLKFLSVLDQITNDILVIHEGRHVIDYQIGNFSSTVLEYRAKLSELAFSKYPTANLRFAVYKPNMGANTTHGNSQLKIVRKLVTWMKANSSEITGYDNTKPTIYQLERLSNENIRKFARSVDPLAQRK